MPWPLPEVCAREGSRWLLAILMPLFAWAFNAGCHKKLTANINAINLYHIIFPSKFFYIIPLKRKKPIQNMNIS
jgi:hypothetical protein